MREELRKAPAGTAMLALMALGMAALFWYQSTQEPLAMNRAGLAMLSIGYAYLFLLTAFEWWCGIRTSV